MPATVSTVEEVSVLLAWAWTPPPTPPALLPAFTVVSKRLVARMLMS